MDVIDKEVAFYTRELRSDEQLTVEQRRAVARRIAESFGFTVAEPEFDIVDIAGELGIEL